MLLLEKKLKPKIVTMKYFSSRTDLWSSGTLHPYIEFYHLLYFWTVGIENLMPSDTFQPTDHTGDNLAEALETVLDAWYLKKNNRYASPLTMAPILSVLLTSFSAIKIALLRP